jgi:thiamine-phosphate pyrophosphorylase
MSDTGRAPDPSRLLLGLPTGGIVVLRDINAVRLADLARDFVPKAHRAGHRVLIAGEPRVALKTNADGVHLSEPVIWRQRTSAWARLRPDWLITGSAHSSAALLQAERAGVDAVLFSSVFPTKSHPGAQSLGIGRFRSGCLHANIPVYGLGGITRTNLRRLRGTYCYGISGIGIFIES